MVFFDYKFSLSRNLVEFLKRTICDLFVTEHSLVNGIIKKKTDRGFGFIGAEGLEKDIFFHGKNLVGVAFDDLNEGDAVTFEVEQSEKGPNAVNVQRVA